MTQYEIIEMARQAGFSLGHNVTKEYANKLETFAKLVAAKEREACVELIKSHGPTLANGFMLTEAIRARGEA